MADLPDGTMIDVNGVNLWHRITGEGEPVVQIHGAGFGHYNLDPVTPAIADAGFTVVDYDSAATASPTSRCQHYDMEVWADDLAGADGRARDRAGARPRDVDGRHGRARLRRQVPGADDLRRHQLRRGEARRRRAG